VTGAWDELELAGLLWDGERLVGIDAGSGDVLERALDSRGPPVSLELGGLVAATTHARLGITLVAFGRGANDVLVASSPPDAPRSRMPARGTPAAWVSIVGRLTTADGRATMQVDGVAVTVERQCGRPQPPVMGVASVRGIALSDEARVIVPCDGIGPAPALSLSASAATGDGERGAPSTVPAASEVSAAAVSMRRSLVVVLLAAGVTVLLLGALAGRRIGSQDGVHTRRGDVPEAADSPGGPQLTLVRVPDERR
jgi:hypothetical protein